MLKPNAERELGCNPFERTLEDIFSKKYRYYYNLHATLVSIGEEHHEQTNTDWRFRA